MAREIMSDNGTAINMLLVGSSSNGKSATGNSILGKPFFSLNTSFSPSPTNVKKACQKFENFNLKVVDGLNVYAPEDCRSLRDFQEAYKVAESGYSVLLFVLKWGEKFDATQAKFANLITEKLGSGALNKYGIIVLTKGDAFEKTQFTSIKDWMEKQTGPIMDLYKLCGQRCVLFDNFTQDENKKKHQMQKLIECIINMNEKNNAKKYDLFEFMQHKPELRLFSPFRDLQENRRILRAQRRNRIEPLGVQVNSVDKDDHNVCPVGYITHGDLIINKLNLQFSSSTTTTHHELKENCLSSDSLNHNNYEKDNNKDLTIKDDEIGSKDTTSINKKVYEDINKIFIQKLRERQLHLNYKSPFSMETLHKETRVTDPFKIIVDDKKPPVEDVQRKKSNVIKIERSRRTFLDKINFCCFKNNTRV